jgi:hypothetical protein
MGMSSSLFTGHWLDINATVDSSAKLVKRSRVFEDNFRPYDALKRMNNSLGSPFLHIPRGAQSATTIEEVGHDSLPIATTQTATSPIAITQTTASPIAITQTAASPIATTQTAASGRLSSESHPMTGLILGPRQDSWDEENTTSTVATLATPPAFKGNCCCCFDRDCVANLLIFYVRVPLG